MQKLSSVLLVDDDKTTNFLSAHLIKILGVTDQELLAHNGQEAHDLLTQYCAPSTTTYPILVLLYINIALYGRHRIFGCLPAPAIHVVILTTSMHASDLARLQALPHLTVLHKPLMRAKIDALLQEQF
jgi:CheY-like chemotaxis protein